MRKKIIFSCLVIFAFVAYVFYQRPKSQLPPLISLTNTLPSTVITNASPEIALGNTSPGSMPPVNRGMGMMAGQYKNGEFTGNSIFVYYGNVQVSAVIQNGKLVDVKFLDYPHDQGTSRRIASIALPQLRTEAIQKQSANVDMVSGATETSGGFRQSLASALAQAKP